MAGLAVVAVLVPPSTAEAAAPRQVRAAGASDPDGETGIEAAQAAAKRTGHPVEVISLRGESRDVFATADGNLEAREYLRPVRTRIDGKWKPVDTGLVASADGGVTPKATTVGLEFSGGGRTPLVRMKKAGRELALSWPDALPVPELDGAVATYRGVLPDVDLRMEAQEDGFTQLLVSECST